MCNVIFRGLLHLANASYGIEPLHNSSRFEHIFYPMDDVHREPLECAVSNVDIDKEGAKGGQEEHHGMTQLLRVRKNTLYFGSDENLKNRVFYSLSQYSLLLCSTTCQIL